MHLAENIARLRRERGMTQEALAETIGVSSQTVSKWETSANCPDVALLPVLADVFGVSIDALYGREEKQRAITPAGAVDWVIERVREAIAGTVWNPEIDGSFAEQLAQYRKAMQSDPSHRSVVENDRDVLYFREALGALALRKPAEGWNTLFAHEGAAMLLRTLAEDDFRRAMQTILKKRLLTFTLPSLMKQCGAQDATLLEKCLNGCGCFCRRELLIDEKPLIYYELVFGEMKLYLLYAVLAFAREYADYEGKHYCFIGNSEYFTP